MARPKTDVRSVLLNGYGVALLAVASATAFRFGLDAVLGDRGHLILLILPVLVGSLRGGVGPGIFAFVTGTVMSFALYPSRVGSRFDEVAEWVTYGMFLLTIGGVILLAQRVHANQSALMRKEAELALLNERLERTVEERTAELRAANDELEGFCHSMAHDMRTPTRAIAGNARILLEDYGDQLPPTLTEHLRRINLAALKQGSLVDALLSYARLAKQPVDREPLDLVAMAYELTPDVARREGCDISLRAPARLEVHADARQLRAALRAILENSARYRTPGSSAHIELKVDDKGRLAISDDGIGFDMAFAHKVRMPFERLQRDEAYAGVGMGLALVARIAERHGGSVVFESAPGLGTTVHLDLGHPVRSVAASEPVSAVRVS